MRFSTRGDLLNLSLNGEGWRGRQAGLILNTVSSVVDHGHNVGEVEALYHHLHEDVVTASAGHKLLQRELAWQEKQQIRSKAKLHCL